MLTRKQLPVVLKLDLYSFFFLGGGGASEPCLKAIKFVIISIKAKARKSLVNFRTLDIKVKVLILIALVKCHLWSTTKKKKKKIDSLAIDKPELLMHVCQQQMHTVIHFYFSADLISVISVQAFFT